VHLRDFDVLTHLWPRFVDAERSNVLRPTRSVDDATIAAWFAFSASNLEGGEWRCEKNGHLLERTRATCPIAGSRAGLHPRPR
jgi:hypothetical protein